MTLKTRRVLPRKAPAEEERLAPEPVPAEERSEEIVMTSDEPLKKEHETIAFVRAYTDESKHNISNEPNNQNMIP